MPFWLNVEKRLRGQDPQQFEGADDDEDPTWTVSPGKATRKYATAQRNSDLA